MTSSREPGLWLRRSFFGRLTVSSGFVLLLLGCHDVLTEPERARLNAPGKAAADGLDTPPEGGSVEFTIGYESPLAGNEQFVAHYSYSTLVAMTVHQNIGITVLPPFPPGTGQLGLAGRVSAWGCSHQGEAYLVSYPDGGGYGFSFAGCQFAGERTRTSYSDTVEVNGTVRYGYTWDAACPYPDYACAAYSGSSGVTLSPLHAKLSITSDDLHDGELWAGPTEEYTVAAIATPARMGRYAVGVLPAGKGWLFKPDSGEEQPDFCRNGSGRSCDIATRKSGSLTLTAIVNGELMESPPLRIQVPEVDLALSRDSVSVGDTVLVTTTVRGADPGVLTGYYVAANQPISTISTTAKLNSTAAAPARMSAPGSTMPPCLGTYPVPTHCYLVMSTPGRTLVYAGANIGRYYFGDEQYVIVRDAAQLKIVIEPSSKTMMLFSRHIHVPNCKEDETSVKRKLHLFVIDSGSALPRKLSNRRISLSLSPVLPANPATPDAGGHVIDSHLGDSKPAGSLSELQVTTDASGDAYVTYTSSEFAGQYEIRASSESATPAADTISVGLKLQPISAGSHFSFIGETPAHPSNHFGTPTMNVRLAILADQFYDNTDVGLEFNDTSLPLGGRFEVADVSTAKPSWTSPRHCDHRWGQGTDVRTRTFQDGYSKANPSPEVRGIMAKWLRLNPEVSDPKEAYFWEGDHLHLKTTR